jgi:hypothetical protein
MTTCRWCGRDCKERHVNLIIAKRGQLMQMFVNTDKDDCWKLKKGKKLQERYRTPAARYRVIPYLALLHDLDRRDKLERSRSCGDRQCYNPWHTATIGCKVCQRRRCRRHRNPDEVKEWQRLMAQVEDRQDFDRCWLYCSYYDEQPVTLNERRWSPDKLAYVIYHGREVPIDHWKQCGEETCVNPLHYGYGDD